MRLENRIALVTGSTRGIGRGIAEAFAREGATVIVNSRDQATAEAAAAEIGGGAVGMGADLSQEAGVDALFGKLEEQFGRLDILVNNAGIPMVRDSLELTTAEWQRTLDLNLTSPFLCSQRAARMMRRAARGNIINIASLTSFAPFPRRLAYATTKAGLVMMTRLLAGEWAPEIRVNAVAPGFIRTDLVLGLAAEGKVDIEALERRIPQHRLGTPEDIAAVCLFLASDESAFITGETILSDGGWLAYGFI